MEKAARIISEMLSLIFEAIRVISIRARLYIEMTLTLETAFQRIGYFKSCPSFLRLKLRGGGLRIALIQ